MSIVNRLVMIKRLTRSSVTSHNRGKNPDVDGTVLWQGNMDDPKILVSDHRLVTIHSVQMSIVVLNYELSNDEVPV